MISLDRVKMHVVHTDESGQVGRDTVFTFAQDGELVSALYQGGNIRLGHLVGILRAGTLIFRYAQVDLGGRLDSGASNCEVRRGADGRIHLVEHFEWTSREGAGVNRFEELP